MLKKANREIVTRRTKPVRKVNFVIRLWLNAPEIFIANIPRNGRKTPGAKGPTRDIRVNPCSPAETTSQLQAVSLPKTYVNNNLM